MEFILNFQYMVLFKGHGQNSYLLHVNKTMLLLKNCIVPILFTCLQDQDINYVIIMYDTAGMRYCTTFDLVTFGMM